MTIRSLPTRAAWIEIAKAVKIGASILVAAHSGSVD